MLSKSTVLQTLEILSQVQTNDKDEKGLQDCVRSLKENLDFNSLFSIQTLQKTAQNASLNNCSRSWMFACISIECLLCLKNELSKQADDSNKLLSVSQQRSVKTLLEKVVDIALLPNLLPNVEPLNEKMFLKPQTSLSDLERYDQLCVVTLALLELCYDDTFHGVLFPQFLTPVLCSLCQLTMVPLKKTSETFPRLQRERLIYQQHLNVLTTKLFQPMVIKELMVIEGNRKSPKWLKRGVGRLLTGLLHRPHGVLAVVQAIRDAADCSAPSSQAYLESVAQVITASHDLDNICPQVLELLDCTDAEFVRVAVLCIRALHARDESASDSHLLQPLTKPLSGTPCSEQTLSLCLQRLHKCFAVPASEFWRLPHKLLKPHVHVLFLLYSKIYQSAVHVRKIVEDLVWCVLSNCEDTELADVFRCLIYREEHSDFLTKSGIEFVFGDDGCVKIEPSGENEYSLEEYGDCIMIILERRDSDGLIGNKLFLRLLEFVNESKEMDSIQAIERKLVTVKLLAVLSENEIVQKSLSKNPEPVVKFLKSMMDSFFTNSSNDTEILSISLVVLNVILNDFVYSKRNSWDVFRQLEQPLARLKDNTKSKELRLLAEEAHEVILTHVAGKPRHSADDATAHSSGAVAQAKSGSSCEEALREACDPLLPVRGHAIMRLGKLLAAGDKQAKTKKDHILCIFQENLKHEDSFLYLSAIEGLATVAAEFPDSVIVSLTEQFGRQALDSETRLKVGEALVRVVKLLGELVPVYKTELVNAFLSGAKDDDFLVRASSLSNLGELCRILSFRIGPILSEVLMCSHCIVSSDPSVEVRRAAVMLISLLLKGLHKDTLLVLMCSHCIVSSDPSVEVRRAAVMLISLLLKGLHKDTLPVLQDVLLEVYRSLKSIYSSDKDSVTRLHAQLALEELNSSTLAFLFPTPQLSKHIYVLDPPF